MINFNFNLKHIDWSKLKNISATNVFLSFCLIGMIFLFFKEEIKEKYLKKDTIVKSKAPKSTKLTRSQKLRAKGEEALASGKKLKARRIRKRYDRAVAREAKK